MYRACTDVHHSNPPVASILSIPLNQECLGYYVWANYRELLLEKEEERGE